MSSSNSGYGSGPASQPSSPEQQYGQPTTPQAPPGYPQQDAPGYPQQDAPGYPQPAAQAYGEQVAPGADAYGQQTAPGANPYVQQTPPGADTYGQQSPPTGSAYGSAPPVENPLAAAVSEQQSPPTIDNPHVVQSDVDAKDGLSKCARCGATDIGLNIATGLLRCNFCRYEWSTPSAHETLRINGDIGQLRGVTIGSGSQDIIPSVDVIMTFKCSACGAEVVIDTNHSMQSRCHWCRNKLSMNEQIPNGAVPDMILPFSMPKDEAINRIRNFVRKRKFFAHPRFRAEFNPENVMGVYMPYMVLDVNGKVHLSGEGEHTRRRYTVKRGDRRETRYDADVYAVQREFDIHINDLTVESSQERQEQDFTVNSNNIINSIMPFDVENSVQYDSNYLAGFTSERRDTNVTDLAPIVRTQSKDIARHKANATLNHYDRGVRWDHEHLEMVGERWVSAYLPVWLYSYYEKRSNGKSFTHYVAVNARTGETMGSVPLHQGKLLAVSAAVQVVGTIIGLLVAVIL